MNYDQVEEIFQDESIKRDLPFSVFLGLEILRKYIPNADIAAAAHDIIYCSVDVEQACNAGITKEDIINLRRMNWIIDEDCFAKFV
jgi:hypothetical protein